MKDIKEAITFVELIDSEYINEAVVEPHIAEVIKLLKKEKANFSDFVKHEYNNLSHIDWNNVTPADTTVFSVDDTKTWKRAIRDNSVILYFKGKNFDGLSVSGNVYTFQTQDQFEKTSLYFFFKYTGFERVRNAMKEKETIDFFKHRGVDKIVSINTSELGTWEIQNKRRVDQSGVIENTPEQNAKIARENVERYKKLVAQNSVSKYKDLDEMVEELSKKIVPITIEYRKSNQYRVYSILRAYARIIDLYSGFCNLYASISDGTSSEYGRQGMEHNYDEIKQEITKLYKEVAKL